MGAIARSAANNITTSGVILPAGINDASVASITGLAQVSAGDGITLISSQTASASASLSFTTGIDSTYRTYMFKFINMHPSTSANFSFNLSTDGGSSYNVTKTSTNFGAYHIETDTDTLLSYDTGQDLAQSTDYQKLTMGGNAGANDADRSFSGTLTLFNPSNTTYVKHFISNSNFMDANPDAYTVNAYVGGYGNTTSAINAIDFKYSSGNIDAGTIHMYGIE
jgi:hypothetical protein